MERYDVAVIGAGPGGYVAAIRASQRGAKVCLVEKDQLGGTCLNRGCIPTKALVASAEAIMAVKNASEHGISIDGWSYDFGKIMARKNAVVTRLRKGVEFLMKKNKIAVLKGEAHVRAPRKFTVTADGPCQEVEADKIIIATGSKAAMIPGFEYDGRTVVTSEEMLEAPKVPETLLVVGGGVIGCEFASIFAAMGTKVTIVDIMPTILPLEDEDIQQFMTKAMKVRGIEIKTGVKLTSVRAAGGKAVATLDNGTTLEAEMALISIGRVPATDGIDVAGLGLATGPKGSIVVNERMETGVPGIYAVGDVTGKALLAHVASYQGLVAADNACGASSTMDYTAVPSCIFTFPEIGSVGLKTQEAKERDIEVKTARFPFAASGKALAMGEADGFVKVVAEPSSGRILGMHIVGPNASDLIAEAAVAVRRGLTAHEVAGVIHAHPTLPEAVAEACEAVLGTPIHS